MHFACRVSPARTTSLASGVNGNDGSLSIRSIGSPQPVTYDRRTQPFVAVSGTVTTSVNDEARSSQQVPIPLARLS